jgi:hypothetical protein
LEKLVLREQLVNKVYLDEMVVLVLRVNVVKPVLLERLVHQVCLDLLVCPDKKERAVHVEILAHQVPRDLQDPKEDVDQLVLKV